MEIGGQDYVFHCRFPQVAKSLAMAVIKGHWPKAIVEDGLCLGSETLFVYKDQTTKQQWNEDPLYDPKDGCNMIQVIVTKDALTLVTGYPQDDVTAKIINDAWQVLKVNHALVVPTSKS